MKSKSKSSNSSTDNAQETYIPDNTDLEIIEALKEDGRMTNASIAKRLSLTEGAIRARIKNLQSKGVLKITGLVNPNSIVDHQIVIIGINIKESNLLNEKAQEISKLEEVLSVSIAAGRYDIFAEIKVSSNHGLIHFLAESLPQVKGIESTESFMMLHSIHKWV
jgi:Lrp/AsnC family transcriptional regulator, regulator for asnA, asnC and gidA